MGKNNEPIEPAAIAKLLADHLERQVPDNADVWPAISMRLRENEAGEKSTLAANRRGLLHTLRKMALGHKPSAAEPFRQNIAGMGRFVRSALGAASLIAILGLAVGAIASLSRHSDTINMTKPPAQTGQLSGDNNYLFSIQSLDEPKSSNYDSGIGLADDGSFWFGREDGSLVHYSPTGERLGTLTPGIPPSGINDIELHDSNLWVLSGDAVYVVKTNGIVAAKYLWMRSFPGAQPQTPNIGARDTILRADGDGQMLLEYEPLKYWKAVDRSGANSWPPPTEYYSAGGKTYNQGNSPNRIMAGDLTVTIDLPGVVKGSDLLQVMPDGSFYVVVVTDDSGGSPIIESRYVPGRLQYVMHFGANGKLIERARAASSEFYTWAKNIAVGTNGNVYALGSPGQPNYSTSPKLNVVRLKFYPTAEALPPAPTLVPTPIIPTPIPTRPGLANIPPPVPSVLNDTPVPTFGPDKTATAQQPTPDNGTPISMVRDGSGFRVEVTGGTVQFGWANPNRGPNPWLDASHLLVNWSRSDYGRSVAYVADLATGRLTRLFDVEDGKQLFVSPDGKQAASIEVVPGNWVRVALINLETGERQIILDPDPSTPRWADPGSGLYEMRGPSTAFPANVQWINPGVFMLKIQPQMDPKQGKWSNKLVLVDTTNRKVRLLTGAGELLAILPDGTLVIQSKWIDGEVQTLAPPYDGQLQTLAQAGIWRMGWSASPDTGKVVWLEMAPPPGDWSSALPAPCCNGDPPPVPTAIVVWDRNTSQISKLPVSNFAWLRFHESWSSYLRLQWSRDSGSVFFATHPDSQHTALYKLSLEGKSTLLAEHDGHGGIQIAGERADGAVYYIADGVACEYCTQIMLTSRDGTTQTLYDTSTMSFHVDQAGRIEILQRGGIDMVDTASWDIKKAAFPQISVTQDQLGWSTVNSLVPISTDGQWAAYAGSNSDMPVVSPNGKPDRGFAIYIVKIK